VRLAVMVEPQFGATYQDQLAAALHTEQCGFDGFFCSDHFLTMGPDETFRRRLGPGQGPTDAWMTLAALAVQTSRIRLGTLMTSATFRHPAVLAVQVAQADQMSRGRIELGLGTGWFEAEHAALGVGLPEVRQRFEVLEEQLKVLAGLWETIPGDTFSFHGKHYRLLENPGLPKPVQQPRPPIIVGGLGTRRSPQVAARFADEFNVPFATVERTAAGFRSVDAASDALGRARLAYSAAQVVACGRTPSEARDRAEALNEPPLLYGSPDQLVDTIGRFREIGADRLYLEILDLKDLDHLELLASTILPQLA